MGGVEPFQQQVVAGPGVLGIEAVAERSEQQQAQQCAEARLPARRAGEGAAHEQHDETIQHEEQEGDDQ
ncbi:hypothetical protein D3C87_2168030 [compost metagenome]